LQHSEVSYEAAHQLKEEGNRLFVAGDLMQASSNFISAFRITSKNVSENGAGYP
jgi:hypothetical protein